MSGADFRDRLSDFLALLLVDLGLLGVEIDADTPLIGDGGLLDSQSLLQLAAWIEAECGAEVDLADIDMLEEWRTVDAIAAFVASRRAA